MRKNKKIGIDYLKERCRSLEDINQRLSQLFNPKDVEWRVITKSSDSDEWYLSHQMYPGMNRESAIRTAELERRRGYDVRIQVRTCSEWTEASDMKSLIHFVEIEGSK